jgi:hypothetical protein
MITDMVNVLQKNRSADSCCKQPSCKQNKSDRRAGDRSNQPSLNNRYVPPPSNSRRNDYDHDDTRNDRRRSSSSSKSERCRFPFPRLHSALQHNYKPEKTNNKHQSNSDNKCYRNNSRSNDRCHRDHRDAESTYGQCEKRQC